MSRGRVTIYDPMKKSPMATFCNTTMRIGREATTLLKPSSTINCSCLAKLISNSGVVGVTTSSFA